jgi:hypothetical protein
MRSGLGNSATDPMFTRAVDATGKDAGTSAATYTLASNTASLPAGGTTPVVTGVQGASYVFAYQFGGTSSSLVLESLGPDGVNYQTITTVTASGTQGIVIGQGATVRLRNAGANAITNLSASLS